MAPDLRDDDFWKGAPHEPLAPQARRPTRPHATNRRERVETRGRARGLPMSIDTPRIVHRDGKNRHGLWWRALEVEKDSALFSCYLSQPLGGLRVQVIAEPEERITGHDVSLLQAQLLDADTNPMSGLLTNRGILDVVIVMGEMLIEVGRCRRSVLLGFSRKHG